MTVIMTHINAAKTIELLAEAINYTVENKMYEFVRTIEWLYNVKEIQIQEVDERSFFLYHQGKNGTDHDYRRTHQAVRQ